jgi:predicted RNA binding protein YcfA (HicA-like mRNA interferase family)
MSEAEFTYGLLDERLRALGFTVHAQKGKARIYKHKQMGASIILPDAPLDKEALPHHLAVVRHVLKEYNIGENDRETAIPSKTYNQYPPGVENLKILIEDLAREYKKEHPEEVEELEVFAPRWYGPPENGLLKIGRSIFVIRNNKVEQEIREAETQPTYWM